MADADARLRQGYLRLNGAKWVARERYLRGVVLAAEEMSKQPHQLLGDPTLLLPDDGSIASFERLSVAMLSRIYELLDAAGDPMMKATGLTYDGLGGSVHHPAFVVIQRWTNEAMAHPTGFNGEAHLGTHPA